MTTLLLGLVLWGPGASAQQLPDPDAPTQAQLLAEYQRLTQELHRYAERQTWNAVERTYLGCVATGAPMSFSDHYLAAYASQARGDMLATHQRLAAALPLATDREKDVVDWLWSIDSNYSKVEVIAYDQAELVPERRPFDPVQRRSIDFAIHTLAETGNFIGLLPRGIYAVDDTLIDIRMGKGAAEVLVPYPEKPKPKRRRKK